MTIELNVDMLVVSTNKLIPTPTSTPDPKPKPNLDTTALVIVLRIDNDGKYCGKA